MGRTPCEEYGHDYESVASWPSGTSTTTTLIRCTQCPDEWEDEYDAIPE